MFANILRADFKRVRFMRLGLVCAVFYAIVALVYLFAARDTAWVSVAAPDGTGCWGFLPDPSYRPTAGGSLEEAIASAAVAHTAFFPLLVLVVVHQLYFTDVRGTAGQASLARGASRLQFLGSKLMVATVVLQGCYLAFSLAVAAAYTTAIQPESTLAVLGSLAGKMLPNCLVNESFIVFCMAVFSWTGHGSTAAGIVFVATLVGLVAQMALGSADLPVHMGYWARASGLGGSSALLLTVLLYALTSGALFGLAAYAGIARYRERQGNAS